MLTFRGLLESREKEGLTELYSTFIRMEKHAEGSWLSLLGGDSFSSYTGIPHIRGVERNVDEAVPEKIKEKFNSTEIFILLASILCHDIGKYLKSQELHPEFDQSSHGQRSCSYILERWPSLLIPREDLARGIAIVCCCHEWKKPIRTKKCPHVEHCSFKCVKGQLSFLDTGIDSDDGYVRLRWIASLLRLADEVDNHVRRAVPNNFIIPKNLSDPNAEIKESWRRHITGIIFDVSGKCIRLRTPKYLDSQWGYEERKWARTGALKAINKVLKHWGPLLNEIGLDFKRAFIDVSLPFPVLLPATTKEHIDEIVFTPEPVLTDENFDRVEMAIKRLSNAVIGKTDYFSWEALAEESNIPDIQLVRLAVKRLVSLKKWPESQRPDNHKFPLDIHISDAGWKMNMKRNGQEMEIKSIKPSDRTIPSIEVLNDLLSPDIKVVKKRGFCARSTENGDWLSPIIAVEGSSGDGKSTLSLQIANNLAKGDWFCLYYSLEQTSQQVLEVLKGYNLFKNEGEKLIDDMDLEFCETFASNSWHELDPEKKRLVLPKLSPRPVRKISDQEEDFFETRYKEIQYSLDFVCGNRKNGEPPKCFYILDSLTAFSSKPLTRSQIHRLFQLFRKKQVPLLITLERQRHWVNNLEEDHFNIARYLADILINLDSQNTGGYFQQTIEVAKSRFSRRVLGKHLMKIKSTGQKSSGQFDTRTGIAIYPSIHLHLVNSHLDDVPTPGEEKVVKPEYQQFIGIDSKLLPICQPAPIDEKTIPGFLAGTCLVIHGAPGGHKFALAMNILMATRLGVNKFGHKLIISLAEENEIQLNGVALFESIEGPEKANIISHLSKIEEENEERGAKISIQHFGRITDEIIRDDQIEEKSTVTVLNFRLGKIMPEEFLYILEEFLNGRGKNVDTILFSDTVQLRTCFPSLSQEGLFLPTLVDFVKSRKLTSIFIDVHDENGYPNEALLAAADCRIYVGKNDCELECSSKNKTTNRKTKIKRNGVQTGGTDKKQTLLLNTIQVDNILGKSYDRNIRYIVARQDPSDNPPTLYITESEEEAKKYWCDHQGEDKSC